MKPTSHTNIAQNLPGWFPIGCFAAFACALLSQQAAVAQSVKARSGSKKPAAAKPVASKAAPRPASDPAPAVKPAETIVKVTPRPNCEVSGPVFTLGEIADIQGEDAALTAKLAAMEVGASPLPGLSRIINPGDITVRLRQHHLDIPRVEVALPPGMRISRSGRDIAVDEITKAALESAKDAIKNLPDATLEIISTGTKLVVPAGKAQILAGAWRGSVEIGTLTVPVSIVVDGKPVQSVDVAFRVHRKTVALVARRAIQLHEIIGPQDVMLMPIDAATASAALLTTVEESLGKRTTRRLLANAPISSDMLEKAPLVSANDSITIQYISGALIVTAPGVARQTGAEGDVIHVWSADTKRELNAVVIDRRTVRVEDR
jgi:flagella basal body P-ring formation protein FlgA